VLLSNEGHGSPDRSRLGVRWSARLYRRGEDPYLKERVHIPTDGTLGYMKQLLDRLEDNCILLMLGENQGRRNVDGVVLGRSVAFASGAPSLAQRTGAELLTAYAIRLGTFRYRVVIEPPIQVDWQLARKDYTRECVVVFCGRLESQIRRHPAGWLAWQREGSGIPVKS